MVEKTTIPLAELKRMTDNAVESINKLEDMGHSASARSLRESIGRANEIIAQEGRYKHGELVAIESHHLACLAADTTANNSARAFLENTGYWE